MQRTKLTFPNPDGEELSGLLETPDTAPAAWALFAHCFTCSKDIAAASRISRSLTERGIAVLRFDFTGLGNSEGDFANTNFSSNLEDLVAAAEYMRERHQAPDLMIGHSLGGAAVLAAAGGMESVKAVVTIGAPATADHLEHLFVEHRDKILDQDRARVQLGGREFTIKKHFLQDIASYNTTEHIAELDKPLLILHSPVDEVVSIDEAARIYTAARHPKSFISLDDADHLLNRRRDSEYVAEVIAGWAGRYLELPEPQADTRPEVPSGHVLVTEQDRRFARRIYTDRHQLIGDEPAASGGSGLGPDPYEQLLAALGSCTSMTMRMYANHKQLPLDDIRVELNHSRIHASDCEECESEEGYVDRIDKRIWLKGDLTPEQRQRVVEIADKCPVHKTLLNEILIKSELIDG